MRQEPHGDSHRMEKLGRGIPALSGRPTPSAEACSLRCPGAEFLGGLERGRSDVLSPTLGLTH